MKNYRCTTKTLIVFLFFLICGVTAHAVDRTFVSARGSDAGPCSVVQPCLTFGRALSQTDAGGEIIVLISGSYPLFTIDKSVSIIASPGVVAGITATASGSAAITIAAASTSNIVLRGLTLNGLGSLAFGIRFVSGGALHVESCEINRFGKGINVEFAGELFIENTVVRNCGVVGMISQTSSGTPKISINRCRFENNNTAVFADDRTQINIHDSVAAGNSTGFTLHANAGLKSSMNLEGCLLTGNTTGISAGGGPGSAVSVRVSNTTITGNTRGVIASSSGSIITLGNNMLIDNATNGSFTGAAALQ
jgi:hypothetical protein